MSVLTAKRLLELTETCAFEDVEVILEEFGNLLASHKEQLEAVEAERDAYKTALALHQPGERYAMYTRRASSPEVYTQRVKTPEVYVAKSEDNAVNALEKRRRGD